MPAKSRCTRTSFFPASRTKQKEGGIEEEMEEWERGRKGEGEREKGREGERGKGRGVPREADRE